MMTFKEFMENDAVERWRMMRAATQGLGSGTVANPQRRVTPAMPAPGRTYGAQQPVGLPNTVLELLRQGFYDGGILNSSLIRALGIDPDHNLVAPNAMLGTPQGAYPFVAEKRAGIPTGKIRFVQGFPFEKAVRLISGK